MKILITGGCGFVGSNLAIYFKNNKIGTKVNTLDNLSRKGSLLNTFLISNGAVFIIGFLNKIIGHDANYWFVCRKPGGDNPFLIGEWPYYLYTFVTAAFILMFIVYIPMWIIVNRNEKNI